MNLFPKVRRPYYVVTPSYTYKSSGVTTLHLLTHALNKNGETAYLVPLDGMNFAANPSLNTPLLLPQHQNFYTQNIDPIVIYPDIIRGNPFNAKNVIRYLLAPRGAHGGDEVFPETDQIWGSLPSIADSVLRLPVCDTNIFYKSYNKRSGSCFYSHKYEMFGNSLLEMPMDCERVCGAPDQVADTLRMKEVCYLYEVSSVITEAALCGCPVELMRTPYFDKIDPECMMGEVKWNDGEKVKSCDDYYFEYQQIMSAFPRQLDNFIKKTQEMA